jgi:hypothetical protein
MPRRVRLLQSIVFSWLLVPSPLLAQEVPAVDVSAGYASVYDSTVKIGYPAGWYASLSGNPSDNLGLELEVNQQIDSGFEFISLLGGPRIMWPFGDRVVPHVRALAGAVRFSRGNVAWNSGAFQIGAGLDIYLAERVGVRVGGDVRRGFGGGDPTASVAPPPFVPALGDRNQARFTLGIVLGLGDR